jgi:hypothetical protein
MRGWAGEAASRSDGGLVRKKAHVTDFLSVFLFCGVIGDFISITRGTPPFRDRLKCR